MARSCLTRRFYRRDAEGLARALLGCVLVREVDGESLTGRIVETEAYLGVKDLAAHSAHGRRTPRNASMYLDAGHAYVYFTYGMHWCFNIVADGVDVPTACLIRALEPIEGLDVMRRNRAGKIPVDRLGETDLCSGPAKLTQALAINGAQDGADLCDGGALHLRRGRAVADDAVAVGPRIGVGYAHGWAAAPLRFYVRGNRHVSRPRS